MRFALALLALVAACSQFAVRGERDPDVDFGSFRTFAWLPLDIAPPVDQQVPDRYIGRKIVQAIDEQLTQKGYVAAAGTPPDLYVTYRLIQASTTNVPLSYARGYWGLHASPDTYDEGTLVIDVIAVKTNTLVWRGTASARLLPTLPFDKAVERAQDAIAHTFKTFPPRTGTS